MIKLRYLFDLYRYFGLNWLVYRLHYGVLVNLGLLSRRMPATDWEKQPLDDFLTDDTLRDPENYRTFRLVKAPRFFFDPENRQQFQPFFMDWDKEGKSPLRIVGELEEGILNYFSYIKAQVGFPPEWHCNPFSGENVPPDLHWSKIDDFAFGDIKIIWEPSRFSYVYDLVRAYWRTGDEHLSELFWRLVEDWRLHNPPQQGPNWKCGQEISFRVMAWCFGLYGFLDSPTTTPHRITMLAQMIAVSGERIEKNIAHALSMQNNHGISEGVGLWTIGVLFPEFRDSSRWRERGREILEALGRELIYADGSFVQHSVNYHRLMLHDYLWSFILADLHEQPFSDELRNRVKQAGEFLYQLQDEISGRVPYYGQNDGALVLPVNNCDYQDFRPVIQVIYYYSTGSRCYDNGTWDEDLLWLFGPEALDAPADVPDRVDLRAEVGGYYTLRSNNGFAFTRCASYKHRPGQADMLHLDLWWQGQNITLDPGTYSYNENDPWNNPFAHTVYHNTVTIDGQSQMERMGKFLWLPWVQGDVLKRCVSDSGQLVYFEGEHNGYQRLKAPVSYWKSLIKLGNNHWVVIDRVTSETQHNYRLHWLMQDFPYQWDEKKGCLTLETPLGYYNVTLAAVGNVAEYSLVRCDASSPRGWQAPYYHYHCPALSLDLNLTEQKGTFYTLFSPERAHIEFRDSTLQFGFSESDVLMSLNEDRKLPLVSSIAMMGQTQDRLDII